MKTLITTLNSKFIHKSLSLRLLYVATKNYHNVDFCEYTIKEDLDKITNEIIAMNNQVVAFSVYIWNVELIKILCSKLKKENKELIIILGGPEVSYEIDYFLDNFDIDYVISGEGEIVFKQLLDLSLIHILYIGIVMFLGIGLSAYAFLKRKRVIKI